MPNNRGRDRLSMNDVSDFEKEFDIDCYIYKLQKDGPVVPVYTSAGERKDNCIHLNLNQKHVSYISNLNGYLLKYKCTGCGRHFRQLSHLKSHRGSCTQACFKVFGWDHFKSTKDIFHKLKLERITVADSEKLFPWFATYDAEAALIPIEREDGPTKWA